MTVAELIQRLQDQDPNKKVMVLDSFNGGGHPRTINLGPIGRTIEKDDAAETEDCEERVGEAIVLIGYGCY